MKWIVGGLLGVTLGFLLSMGQDSSNRYIRALCTAAWLVLLGGSFYRWGLWYLVYSALGLLVVALIALDAAALFLFAAWLYHHDTRREAADPQTPQSKLRELSQHRFGFVRRRVARNPNIDEGSLLELLAQHPRHAFRNPALDLLLVTNPSLLEKIPHVVWGERAVPERFLCLAATLPSWLVRQEVARNKSTPAELRLQLQREPHPPFSSDALVF